jgi:hypothetical protein
MEEFLAQAKIRTLEHAEGLLERHGRMPGLSQRELRDLISAVEEAQEAELANAG